MSPLLSGWAHQAADHWKRFRPKLYQQLQSSGRLEEAANRAAELTKDELSLLIERGASHQEAWEQVREKYLFLPSEEDQPELGGPNVPL